MSDADCAGARKVRMQQYHDSGYGGEPSGKMSFSAIIGVLFCLRLQTITTV